MASTGDDDSEFDSLSRDEINSDGPFGYDETHTRPSDSDLDDEDFGFSDGSDERENRFVGTSSNWRFLTENERALASSLDQQQANDLSLHLYSAHSLKALAHDAEPRAPNRKSSRSKKRKTEIEDEDDPAWCPDASWTAWPMKPVVVPRKLERFGVPLSGPEDEGDDGTPFRRAEEPESGTDLPEEIQALMLKKATAKLREETTNQSVRVEEVDCLIDDEKAEEVLEPARDKIRSQLDDLLWKVQSKSRRRAEKRKRSRSATSHSRSVSRGSRRANSNSRQKFPISSEFIDESDSDSSAHLANGRRPRNLKGWKEVLEAAALVGFDQAAVQRAADRCTALFGGDVTIPTLYDCPFETCDRHGQPFEKRFRWREHMMRTHKYELAEVYDIEAGRKSTDGGVIDEASSSSNVDRDDLA